MLFYFQSTAQIGQLLPVIAALLEREDADVRNNPRCEMCFANKLTQIDSEDINTVKLLRNVWIYSVLFRFVSADKPELMSALAVIAGRTPYCVLCSFHGGES